METQEICFKVESTGVGLQDWLSILNIFKKSAVVEKVVLYGSRAKENYKSYSDVDLTVFGQLSLIDLQKIENQIDDLNLPYIVDLSRYDIIKNLELLDHIKRMGKVVYQIGDRKDWEVTRRMTSQ